jgi:3-hydroxybutyryl-CoA dehydratase
VAKVGFDSVELGTKLPGVVRFVDQKVITKNAVASLDYNPIHVDPAWAKKVDLLGQGTTIAHGMCTMSFMASAITDWCYASGGFISRMETKFIEPVRPGDTITCNGVVTELHPRQEGRSFVVLELSAENQKGVKVSSGKADVRLPR